MLDKKFILDNAATVQKNCDNRGVQVDIDRYVSLETERRQLQQSVEELSRQANLVSKSIGKAKDDTEREERKNEGRRLREEKDAKQTDLDRIEAEAGAIYRSMPNMTHPDVPVGDEACSKELRRGVTEIKRFGFPVQDHVELAQQHDLVDFEGGARIAGNGFYFLKNEAVLLEMALQQYAIQLLVGEGFTPMVTPDLARGEILQGIGFIPRGPETQIYSIENQDLNLVATAGKSPSAGSTQVKRSKPRSFRSNSAASAIASEPKPGPQAEPPAGFIACINSQKSKCLLTLCPTRVKQCTIIFAISNARYSMG